MGSRLSQEQIIERFRSLHGDKYDYSKFVYIDALTKSTIICPIHGEFQQKPAKHFNTKQGCIKCGKNKAGESKQKSQSLAKNFNIEQPEDYKLIYLGGGSHAKVDNEEFDTLSKMCWKLSSTGYGQSTKNGLMHRIIMNAPTGMFVDHINRDRLDNRKCNLRVVTKQENTFNSTPYGKSKYKGVSWSNQAKKWHLQIVHNKRLVYSEYFDNEEEAARVYDREIIQYHGEFAYLNFPEEALNG